MNNTRIQELIRTKSTILFPGTDVVDCTITDIEKFAELIVRECAKVGERYADGNYEVFNQILEHFGLEEE